MNDIMTLEEVLNFEPSGLHEFEEYMEATHDVPYYRDPIINQIFEDEFDYMLESDANTDAKIGKSASKMIASSVKSIDKRILSIKKSLDKFYKGKSLREAIGMAESRLTASPGLRKVRIDIPNAKSANVNADTVIKTITSIESKATSGSAIDDDLSAQLKNATKALTKDQFRGVKKSGGFEVASTDKAIKTCKEYHKAMTDIISDLEKEKSAISSLRSSSDYITASKAVMCKESRAKIIYAKFINYKTATTQILKALMSVSGTANKSTEKVVTPKTSAKNKINASPKKAAETLGDVGEDI